MIARRIGLIGAGLAALSMHASAAPAAGHACYVIGMGLVSGLDNTGDDFEKIPFTAQALKGYLQRLGVIDFKIDPARHSVAAVMVTANIPSCAQPGDAFAPPLDVTVSAMGTATSLAHGMLLPTSLQGPDNQVYAVASGPLAACAANSPHSDTHACIVAGARMRQPSDP